MTLLQYLLHMLRGMKNMSLTRFQETLFIMKIVRKKHMVFVILKYYAYRKYPYSKRFSYMKSIFFLGNIAIRHLVNYRAWTKQTLEAYIRKFLASFLTNLKHFKWKTDWLSNRWRNTAAYITMSCPKSRLFWWWFW